MASYLWECEHCEIAARVDRSISDRDKVPSTDEATCLCETPEWTRVFEAAGITRATYVAGTKRKGFAELKEAAMLEVKAANLPPSERGEISKEIRRLRTTTKGEN